MTVVTFCFIILILNHFALAEESNIYGYWLSAPRSGRHIKEIIEFNPNGTSVSMMSIMLDATYKLDRNILKIFDCKSKENTITYEIQLNKNALTMTCEGKKEFVRKLTRIGNENSTATGVVGMWYLNDPIDKNHYFIFTSDGMMFFRAPVPPGVEYKYAVEGSTIKRWNGKNANKLPKYLKWKVEGDLLILESNKDSSIYKRVPNEKVKVLPNKSILITTSLDSL